MPSPSRRLLASVGAMALTASMLAACGSDDSGSDTPAAAADTGKGAVDLKAAGCPSTIVIQTEIGRAHV